MRSLRASASLAAALLCAAALILTPYSVHGEELMEVGTVEEPVAAGPQLAESPGFTLNGKLVLGDGQQIASSGAGPSINLGGQPLTITTVPVAPQPQPVQPQQPAPPVPVQKSKSDA